MRLFRRGGMAFGCLMIILAVVLCSGVTTFALDRLCYGSLSQRLPIYPGATIKSRTHNLFNEFGMGNTVMVLTSPDDPNTVMSWYAVETSQYLKRAVAANEPFFRMAQGEASVTRNSDGEGSQIILLGTCVN